MSEVQRYYVGKYGLVEGEALGRLSVVLAADLDRVTAENSALQALLTAADEREDRRKELLQMFIDNSDDKDVVELCRHALKPAEGRGDE